MVQRRRIPAVAFLESIAQGEIFFQFRAVCGIGDGVRQEGEQSLAAALDVPDGCIVIGAGNPLDSVGRVSNAAIVRGVVQQIWLNVLLAANGRWNHHVPNEWMST